MGAVPHAGLSPTTSQQAAGSLIEQPVSVPIARSQRSSARAAAFPLEEPPVVRPGWTGLWHVPYQSLVPRTFQANSGRWLLPTMLAPAASARVTTIASSVGTLSE